VKALPVTINWHPGLPIFSSESFLKAVGDEYGWIGGIGTSGKLRCVLPYTILQKSVFRMVRFRVETIQIGNGFDVQEEKLFLDSVIGYFRSIDADIIIPATTNTIFRTYPHGADVAPYGSYVIDLLQTEESLWRNIERITRQNINTAKKNGVTIRSGLEHIDEAYKLIVDTFKRSKLPFMSLESFKRYMNGLGENGKVMIADYKGVPQSYGIFAFSDYCAYAVYAGNTEKLQQGANKLLYWEAIRSFKNIGVQRYDFVGARVDPEKGSKAWSINLLKKHFGAKFIQGYMWKYPLRPLKAVAYSLGVRFFRGGDIVDLERHKMKKAGQIDTQGIGE
jgi:hypothetical protein